MNGTPIRVGLVIGQLSYGGAESQAYELARGLASRHDVVVYCLSSSSEPYGTRLADAGITAGVFKPLSVLVEGTSDEGTIGAIAAAVVATEGIEAGTGTTGD